jgi:hypothetical protein
VPQIFASRSARYSGAEKMRRTVRLVITTGLLFLVAAPGIVSAQKEFEGAVTMNMNTAGMSVDVLTLSKAGKVRQEMSMMGQNMVSIIDASAGTGLVLMPAMQMYMKLDLKALADQAGNHEMPKITPAGTTETIVGHTCENYNLEMQSGTMVMCVAKDLGFYTGSLSTQGPGAGGNASMQAYMDVFKQTFKDGFFPLKMTMSAEGQSMTMTVTRIEPKPVSDDQFKLDIPAGYTEMKMPGRGPGGSR